MFIFFERDFRRLERDAAFNSHNTRAVFRNLQLFFFYRPRIHRLEVYQTCFFSVNIPFLLYLLICDAARIQCFQIGLLFENLL